MRTIIAFFCALVAKLFRRKAKDGYDDYRVNRTKVYCDRCGDEPTPYGCYSCWKHYGA